MKDSLLSVGIDIGTTTTQLVFSRIEVENTASSFSVPRVEVVAKEVIYRSGVYFTPLLSPDVIDAGGVGKIIAEEYRKAGVLPKDVKAGAVIITGETARKENAKNVTAEIGGFAGNFVVTTAGSDFESIIAGYGSGAAEISKRNFNTVANFDVGGGTTNVAVFDNGSLAATSCLNIGARLVKIEKNGRVSYIAPHIKKIASKIAPSVEENKVPTTSDIEKLSDRMAGFFDELAKLSPKTPEFDSVITSHDLDFAKKINASTFSGGVADFIYQDESNPFPYGDIGVFLGKSIRKTKLWSQTKIEKPAETLRATVIGAGMYTMDISGSTISYSEWKKCLPIMNLPILKLTAEDELDMANAIAKKIEWYRNEDGYQPVGIAFEGRRNPSFDEVNAFARDIAAGTEKFRKFVSPLAVIVKNDMAKALGNALAARGAENVVSIDGIEVKNGDYIDIGVPISAGRVIPVVIKTLIFGS